MSDALSTGKRGRRILSLVLPRLSTDRLIRSGRRGRGWSQISGGPAENKPLAIVAKIKNAVRVVATNRIADECSIRRGQSLSDARAAVPDLCIAEADEAADMALLEAIADWCDRYTPLVALDLPNGLFLDISGCSHLFAEADDDGESILLTDCLSRLCGQGFQAYGAIASTAGVAWAVAHYGDGGCVASGCEREAIASLPIAALRIDREQVALLIRLGLKRVGDILDQPRVPFATRFGDELLHCIDQVLGIDDEVLSPRRPVPFFSAERRFAEPVSDQDTLLAILHSLAHRLYPALERNGIGARLLEAVFYRTDGEVFRILVRAANPVRAPESVGILFSERLSAIGDDFDAGFGFDMTRLSVLEGEALNAAQADFSEKETGAVEFEKLVNRLGARLGPSRVTRVMPVDSHVPERAVCAVPLAARSLNHAPRWPPLAETEAPLDRPLRLLPRPEIIQVVAQIPEGAPRYFRWRRAGYNVVRSEGPERIATEWWKSEDAARATRDYFRVEDTEGRRYWLFREGLYGREMSRPTWYMQGLFG